MGADVPIAAPKHLMAINLFFLRTSPVGAQYCYPYFTNEQWRHEVSPARSGCSPSLPTATLVQVCWGMAGAVSCHPRKEAGEVRGAEHMT